MDKTKIAVIAAAITVACLITVGLWPLVVGKNLISMTTSGGITGITQVVEVSKAGFVDVHTNSDLHTTYQLTDKQLDSLRARLDGIDWGALQSETTDVGGDVEEYSFSHGRSDVTYSGTLLPDDMQELADALRELSQRTS